MRITGGEARGRSLRAPRSRKVRPTADKVRGAIFNILEARYEIQGKRLLDLFAGSGALGLDALSRGAEYVTFIDESREACSVIRQNLARSGLMDRAEVRRLPLPRALARLEAETPFSGAFLDPPYRQGLCQTVLGRLGDGALLEPWAWVVAEYAREETLLDSYGTLVRRHERRYGSTAISIYVRMEDG
ncbi:MAG: 16S rRNA (guanine(966)-N(2))-methyltransferase RsmD [Candidatus Binatia bacterium]